MRESLIHLGISPLVSMSQHLQKEDSQCMIRSLQTLEHQNSAKGELSSMKDAASSSKLVEQQDTDQAEVRHCSSRAAMDCLQVALHPPFATGAPLFRKTASYKQKFQPPTA
jgi:hypothetical protein